MKKTLFAIAGSLLCVVLCLLTFLSCLSFLAGVFLDDSAYIRKVVNERYVSQIEEIVIDRLESDSLYYDIPMEYIRSAIKKEELEGISKQYVQDLIYSFKSGGEIPKAEYDKELFVSCINRYLADYPEIGAYYEEETVIELAQELKITVDNALNSFINVGLVRNMAVSVYSNRYVAILAKSFCFIIGAAIICCGLLVIFGGSSVAWSLYKAAGAVWCGAVLLAVPAYLVQKSDFISKVILDESPFKTLVDGIYYLILNAWVDYATWLLAVISVLLLAAIVWVSLLKKNTNKKVVKNEEN